MQDAEDIFSESLQSFYDLTPITLADAGAFLNYDCSRWLKEQEGERCTLPRILTLRSPDTSPANWKLHASSIWMSSMYIADHLSELRLDEHIRRASEENRTLQVLELGAGAGLPGILIARCYDGVHVTTSDYPDEKLLQTLEDNIERNSLSTRCRAVPYSWGSDPSRLLSWDSHDADAQRLPGFDVIVAADTLWNSELHALFLRSLSLTLRRSAGARAYVIAGLHTGRYAIQAFLKLIPQSGLVVSEVEEKAVKEDRRRTWQVDRAEGEDETERRRWVVWISLKWASV